MHVKNGRCSLATPRRCPCPHASDSPPRQPHPGQGPLLCLRCEDVRNKGALLARLEPPKKCDLGFPGGFGGYSRFRPLLGPLARALSRGPPSAGSAGSPVPQRGADGSLGLPLLRSSADSKFKGRNGECPHQPPCRARLLASRAAGCLLRIGRPMRARPRFPVFKRLQCTSGCSKRWALQPGKRREMLQFGPFDPLLSDRSAARPALAGRIVGRDCVFEGARDSALRPRRLSSGAGARQMWGRTGCGAPSAIAPSSRSTRSTSTYGCRRRTATPIASAPRPPARQEAARCTGRGGRWGGARPAWRSGKGRRCGPRCAAWRRTPGC